jgi:hypothetical protein
MKCVEKIINSLNSLLHKNKSSIKEKENKRVDYEGHFLEFFKICRFAIEYNNYENDGKSKLRRNTK